MEGAQGGRLMRIALSAEIAVGENARNCGGPSPCKVALNQNVSIVLEVGTDAA
jgi:hypothetical protein